MYIVKNRYMEYKSFTNRIEARIFIKSLRLTVERYQKRTDCCLIEVSESFARCPWDGVR